MGPYEYCRICTKIWLWGSQASPGYRRWGKQLPPIRDAGGTGLKGGDLGWEGDGTAWPGYPIASVLPCTSPQTCQALVSLLFGGCPLPQTLRGAPAGAGSQTARPRGTPTKTEGSGQSPRRALSSGRGPELGAVSINSPCPRRPRCGEGDGRARGASSGSGAGAEKVCCSSPA